jgi:PAS domain S-box-containing protein
MRQLRTESFQWLVGLFCGLLGTIMLVSPHQFQFVDFPILQNDLYVLGLSLLFTGILMLLVIIFVVPRLVEYLVHLVSAFILMSLATALVASGGIINGINLTVLGLACGIVPFIRSSKGGRPAWQLSSTQAKESDGDYLALVIGLSSSLTGLILLWPREVVTYNYSLGVLEGIFFGLLFVVIGFVMYFLQATPDVPKRFPYIRVRAYINRAAGLLFFGFIFAAAQPGKFWLAAAYYGWFGFSLLILPRLFTPAARFDSTLLYSRLSLAFGIASALPLILAVAFFNYISETSLQFSNTAALYQVRDLMFGVLLVLLSITVFAGVRLAHFLVDPLERLSAAAQAMANEDMDAPLPESSITEIGFLASSFRTLRSRLIKRTEERERVQHELEEHQARLEARVVERTHALQESNQRLEAVLKALPVGVFIADAQGAILEKNKAVDLVWGIDTPLVDSIDAYGTFVGWKADSGERLAPEDWGLARAVSRGEVSLGEIIDIERFNGERATIINSAAPIIGPDGKIAGGVAVVQDISKQRQLEKMAREQAREAYRNAVQIEAIFNSMTDAVVVFNQDGIVQQANPQAIALYGFDPVRLNREMIRRKLKIRDEEGQDVILNDEQVRRALAGESSVNRRLSIINSRGRSYQVLSSTAPVSVGRSVVGLVEIWHDITEREKLLAENNRQRELLQRLVEVAPVGIAFLKGPEFRFTLINAAYEHMARGRGNLIGKKFAESWPEVENDIVPLLEEVCRSGESFSAIDLELHLLREGVREKENFTVSFTPILGDNQSVEGVMVLAMETTEEVRARQAVVEEHSRLQAIIENAPEGIILIDREGKILLSNPISQRIYGRALEGTQLTDPHTDLMTYQADGSPYKPEDLPVVQSALYGLTFNNVEAMIRSEEGNEIPVLVNSAPVMDSNGQVSGAVAIFQDMTELKQALQALRVSEAHQRAQADELRTIMDVVPVSVWIAYDAECHNMTGNKTAYAVHRLPAGTNPTQTPKEGESQLSYRSFMNGEEIDNAHLPMQIAAKSGEELKDLEVDIVFENGERRHLFGNVSPLKGEHGIPRGAVAAFMDISELVEAERALRSSEARFRGLVESIDDIVLTLDRDQRFTGIFGRSLERYNILSEEFVGKTIAEIVGTSSPIHMDVYHQALSGESVVYDWVVGSGQDQRFFQVSASPLGSENGQPAGVVAVTRDITAIKRAEQALGKYAHQLKRSNNELEQFAFIASHDLQEPLRKIHAFGERIREKIEDQVGEEEKDYLERMMSASNRMQKMVADLLAFSRVTTKGQPFELVDLNRVAKDVISNLELRIEQTGGTVEIGDLPVIEGDPVQMNQLLQNLIGNALKYHDNMSKPEVWVTAEVIKVNGGNRAEGVRLKVADNGIGFDEKYLERIFQPFERLHGRSEYEGTGMGLAICKKIVERHQGSISAVSTPGQGSTFIVELPIKQAENHEGQGLEEIVF